MRLGMRQKLPPHITAERQTDRRIVVSLLLGFILTLLPILVFALYQ